MFTAEWCTPMGMEPFEWQKRRMESLLSSIPPDWARQNRLERRAPMKRERIIKRSPLGQHKAAGMAMG